MACADQAEIGVAPGVPAAARVEAALELEFEFDPAAGRTLLVASRQEAPLQVVRAFALEDGSALAHMHNVSGGVLSGDHLELRARVGAGASAQLTTTGATRIYRAREFAPDSVQINQVTIAENALLEYVPDAVIPFCGARFRQQTTIQLSPGAGLFWWEIIAPGREARGEMFAYERMQLNLDIWTASRLIASERICLEPHTIALPSLARLGDYRYWAGFYICRVGVDPKTWLMAEQHLRDVVTGLDGEARWGVSTMASDGLLVRGLAREGRALVQGLKGIWSAAKLLLYGREALPPRKVY